MIISVELILFKVTTGYDKYLSTGQANSVRSLTLLPPGETLLINLPTGSGKSVVGHFPRTPR